MERLKTYQCWTTSLSMTLKNAVKVNAATPLWAAYDYAGQLLKAKHEFDVLDVFVLSDNDRRLHRFRVTGGHSEETLSARHV